MHTYKYVYVNMYEFFIHVHKYVQQILCANLCCCICIYNMSIYIYTYKWHGALIVSIADLHEIQLSVYCRLAFYTGGLNRITHGPNCSLLRRTSLWFVIPCHNYQAELIDIEYYPIEHWQNIFFPLTRLVVLNNVQLCSLF